jgi:uncharacterized membrane protein YkvI
MQSLAGQLSPALAAVYAVLLLAAMFNGALSCMFGAAVQLFGENTRRPGALAALWAAAFLCSLVGFRDLVATVYPVCGYTFLLAMPFALWNGRRVRQTCREKE